jgi:glycine dehydrogenase subunit 1
VRVAENNMALARYAVERLCAVKGVELLNNAPFGSEVALRLPKPAAEVVKAMAPQGMMPGYPVGRDYSGMENVLLLSCTEANNRSQIDKLAEILGGLL